MEKIEGNIKDDNKTDYLDGKTVLITGGTGSLGKALVHRFLTTGVRKIIIYSRDEFKQFNMERQFRNHKDRLRFFIGDVRDRHRLYRAFTGVDIVIHAAALKHVHLMEYNPNEAVNTNITGASNIIDAAIDCDVEKVVSLSTDKAVNPINIYGATKLVSDKLFRHAHAYGGEEGPSFITVRYGNVMGSRGSVVPFFRDLAAKQSPTLPITDMRMTRFWITMDQSVDLVIGALNDGLGGEVFISRIPSCRITDLAEAIHPGARLVETGIRPGEKLHEDLLTEDEARSTYDYGDHLVVYPLVLLEDPGDRLKPGGELVPRGFRYSSDNNSEMLNVDQLREMLKDPLD
jgi:UDP-N-acetylglucosamine 4,6-dehydratase (inverting)